MQRRETWLELCERNMNMHIKKHPALMRDIKYVYDNFVLTKKILPSMRSLQFGGKAIELNNSRIYNCAFLPVDDIYWCWKNKEYNIPKHVVEANGVVELKDNFIEVNE